MKTCDSPWLSTTQHQQEKALNNTEYVKADNKKKRLPFTFRQRTRTHSKEVNLLAPDPFVDFQTCDNEPKIFRLLSAYPLIA